MFGNSRLFTVAGAVIVAALLFVGCSDDDSSLSNNNQNNNDHLCPSGYVYVPGGTFTMGVDESDVADLVDFDWSPAYGPAHTVTVSSFCISKTETTVEKYRACRSAGNCTGEGPWPIEQDSKCNYSDTDESRNNHPVNCVTHDQAREYCQSQGGDLPSESQWVRAAQGDDRRFYPWGNSVPTCNHANWDVNGIVDNEGNPNGEGCSSTEIPPYSWTVGSAPAGASPYGALDMAGNVSEFVLDCWLPFTECDGELGCVDPVTQDCQADPSPIVLGGNFVNPSWGCYVFQRTGTEPNYSIRVGFRCVHSPVRD